MDAYALSNDNVLIMALLLLKQSSFFGQRMAQLHICSAAVGSKAVMDHQRRAQSNCVCN
jgi:hypothetical protein